MLGQRYRVTPPVGFLLLVEHSDRASGFPGYFERRVWLQENRVSGTIPVRGLVSNERQST